MHIPKLKDELVKKARHEIKEIEKQSKAGVITDSERYNKIIDLVDPRDRPNRGRDVRRNEKNRTGGLTIPKRENSIRST
jgi:DNA-directed RNA polymerase beta' subunit